jgi:GTP pyrophosphokinase
MDFEVGSDPPFSHSLFQLDEVGLEKRLLDSVGHDARVAKAVALTSEVHKGSTRDEGTPYLRHPLRVALILHEELGVQDPDLICAAVLHDVLEDSPHVDREALHREFGDTVATLVFCLTDEFQSVDLTRSERKARYLQRMAQEDELCLFVKLCDRLDNVRSLSLSPYLEKRRSMIQETEHYLMPVFQYRQGPFSPLGPLLRKALMDAKQSTSIRC